MKLKRKAVICSAIVTGMLLTNLTGVSLAVTSDSTSQDTTAQQDQGMPGGPGGHGGPGGQGGGPGQGAGFDNGFFGGLVTISLDNTNDSSQKTSEKPSETNRMETLTASLVEEGIISQDTADKMIAYEKEKQTERTAEMEKIKAMTDDERKAYFESQKASESTDGSSTAPSDNDGKGGSLTQMVEAGILTQTEADAISEYQKTQADTQQAAQQANQLEKLNTELDALVAKDLITDDQATAMLNYYKAEQTARETEMEKIKAMTDDERKAYLESQKSDTTTSSDAKIEPGSELVTAGILTQDEADAILSYYKGISDTNRQKMMTEQLASLVSDGTITSDQQDKIIAYLSEQDTAAASQATKAEKPAAQSNRLQSLIDDGTLTQDQADAVCKAIFHMGNAPKMPADESTSTTTK